MPKTSAAAEMGPPLEQEIPQELQQEFLKHPGKWVAFTSSEIVAVGDTAGEVLREATKRKISGPMLYHVPEGEHTAYFF